MKFSRVFRNLTLASILILMIVAITATPVLAIEVITLDTHNGSIGQEVTITGQGFVDSTEVHIIFSRVNPGSTINYQTDIHEIVRTVPLDSAGRFSTIFSVPAVLTGATIDEAVSSGTYYVYVTYYYPDRTVNKDGISVLAITSFTIIPSTATINQNEGVVGTNVEIDGTGFGIQETIRIEYDGSPVEIVSGDLSTSSGGRFYDTSILIPTSAAGQHTITIIGDDSAISAEVTFTVKPDITVTPDSGPADGIITVTGNGYPASRTVFITFSDIFVASPAAGADGSFNANFTVPATTQGNYTIQVTDSVNQTSIEESFTVTESQQEEETIALTSESAPGYVGSELTLNVSGFTPGAEVVIGWDGVQIAKTIVDSNGSFSTAITVPASIAGEHDIVATDYTNTVYFTFTMESEPPAAPALLQPEMNVKASPETYFDWADVTDLSGLTYSLQIATSQDFSSESIVHENTGLTASEYTVPTDNRLQAVSAEAPYYWRVKAVDGASNEGQWSGTGAFYVSSSFGLTQPVIYTIIGVCALLLAVFSFWLGRKTAYY
ncbi:hypothetical protein ACFLW0_02315 [Chloroflexota bacterium]